MVASLWHQLLSTKVRLLVRLPAGVLRGAVECSLAEGGVQNHYLSGVQTNSGTGANHYSFVVQSTIGL